MKLIDAHVHLSERNDDMLIPFARKNGLRYNLSELMSLLKQYDAKALLLSPPVKGWKPCPNEKILQLCDSSQSLLYPVLTVQAEEKSVQEALKLAEGNKERFKGFKILLGYEECYPDDKAFDRLYDYCEEHGIPVLFHTGDTATQAGSLIHSHPLNLDRLSNLRRELKIVACHFGNPWILDTAELIYKHENIYADISGMIADANSEYSEAYLSFLADRISEAIYYVGNADKVLFGTDYPVSKYQNVLKLVENLKISEKDKRKILNENAKKLFSL